MRESLVPREDDQVLQLRLGDQHSVERVAVVVRKSLYLHSVVKCDLDRDKNTNTEPNYHFFIA